MADHPTATVVPADALLDLARARAWGFYAALVCAILLLAGPMAPFLVIPVGWPFLGEQLGVHQFHDIGVATLLWLMLIGLITQFRHARRQVGAMQQTLVIVILMLVATASARPATLLSPLLLPFGFAFLAAGLHPARGEIARIRWHLDLPAAAASVAAAVPLLAYAAQQLRLDSSALPMVAHGGHWTAMASLAATIAALALLSANRPRGWRIPAWSAGAAATLFGVASFSLQHQASSVAPVWSGLAVAWGIGFILLNEARIRHDGSLP